MTKNRKQERQTSRIKVTYDYAPAPDAEERLERAVFMLLRPMIERRFELDRELMAELRQLCNDTERE